MRRSSIVYSAGLGLLTQAHLSLAATFDWSAITPSPDLQYHPCYDGFQCARLTVPRDWLDTSKNKTVALAVIALPATVAQDDPTFGGTIITNPGGPGGSGIDFLGTWGRELQQITEGSKHYEILSFDPRGVANTWPRVDCFGSEHLFARDSYQLELRGTGGMGAGDNALRRSLAMYDGFGSLCQSQDLDEDIQAYISTASVARDIIEIADRVEEHRQARNISARHVTAQHPIKTGKEKKSETLTRVLYWGFSYGTALGNTLASMFPGRMGRVVLDGVVDIHDYMGVNWLRNLQDTDKIIDYFYESCFAANESCPLWADGDASGGDIQSRVDKLIADADAHPVTYLPDDGASHVRVLTGADIRSAFISPVYMPLPTLFDSLALTLAEALQGNYSLLGQALATPQLQDACSVDNSTTSSAGDAQAAILCGDGQRQNSTGQDRRTFPFWQEYVAELTNQSSTLGPYWSNIASSCSGWRIIPKWIFEGPWVTPEADSGLSEDAPAAPILFTSTRLDPVTPLANAYRMSNDHPGSSVLMLDSVGHCAIGNGWSECLNAAIRAYFDDGVVPENGTVCADTTCRPFTEGGKCQAPQSTLATRSVEDKFGKAVSRPLGLPF